MPSELEKRAAVYACLRASQKPADIIKFLGYPRQTVYDIKKRFDAEMAENEAGDNEESCHEEPSPARKAHNRRNDALDKKDEQFVNKLQKKINKNPGLPMRRLAEEIGVDERTVRRYTNIHIRYKSYKMRRGQFMSAKIKATRFEKAKKMVNKLKNLGRKNTNLIFFSDEKNFIIDQKVNRQNDRWLCDDPKKVPVVMSSKFPASVMVLGVMSNEGDIMPPHFFETGLRVNAETYIDVLRDVVKPWMDGVAGGHPYVFQQDGAPAHNAAITQTWLANNLPDFWGKDVWPPSSPDCNPLDYYLWGTIERSVNRSPHNTVESLKRAIEDTFSNLPRGEMTRACCRFRSRIEAVVEAEGDFID